MKSIFDAAKKKNFTPLTDTLYSLDKNPTLRKIANKILTDIVKSTKLSSNG